jgi:hypothetical protein
MNGTGSVGKLKNREKFVDGNAKRRIYSEKNSSAGEMNGKIVRI